jgi:hypothetical protein
VCSDPRPAGASAEQWQKTRESVDALMQRVSEDFLSQALGRIGMTAP